MELHNVTQGSAEWQALRAQYFTASEAPAMMGASSYTTRQELLAQKHTSLVREVDAATQRRFDAGHETEAAFRPVAEEIIGDELYPCTGSIVVDGLRLLASFDGLTMDRKVGMEHKLLNQQIADAITFDGEPGPAYYWQLEQQLLVSGADKILFATSNGTKENMVTCWYESKPERRAALIAGWKQFAEDLKSYTPTAAAPVVVAKVVGKLPVVFDMRVEGKLVACNIEQFKPAALAYIEAISTTLTTDQDFVDADADAKFCRDSADKLELSIEQALGQMGDINTALNAVREIAAAFDAKGLALEKLVKAEKLRRKGEIAADGVAKFKAHMDGLATRLGGDYMPQIPVDFGGAISGLKNLASMENAVKTELARAKIAANEMADRIDFNMKWLDTNAVDYVHLFAIDKKTLVQKPHDDFKAVAENRISTEKARNDLIAEQAAEAAKTVVAAAAQTAAPAVQAAMQEQAETGTGMLATHVAGGTPVVRHVPAAEFAKEKPTLKLGEICERLGFTVTADFLASLGFEATVERNAKLYRESAWPAICEALIQHITQVTDLQVA